MATREQCFNTRLGQANGGSLSCHGNEIRFLADENTRQQIRFVAFNVQRKCSHGPSCCHNQKEKLRLLLMNPHASSHLTTVSHLTQAAAAGNLSMGHHTSAILLGLVKQCTKPPKKCIPQKMYPPPPKCIPHPRLSGRFPKICTPFRHIQTNGTRTNPGYRFNTAKVTHSKNDVVCGLLLDIGNTGRVMYQIRSQINPVPVPAVAWTRP